MVRFSCMQEEEDFLYTIDVRRQRREHRSSGLVMDFRTGFLHRKYGLSGYSIHVDIPISYLVQVALALNSEIQCIYSFRDCV